MRRPLGSLRNLSLVLVLTGLGLLQTVWPSLHRGASAAMAPAASALELGPARVVAPEKLPALDELLARLGLAAEKLPVDSAFAALATVHCHSDPGEPALAESGAPGPVLMLNGFGDFHHLTYFLLERDIEPLGVPFSVVNFDAHDDSHDVGQASIDCGSWAHSALSRLDHLQRYLHVGLPHPIYRDAATWMSKAGPLAGRMDVISVEPQALFFSRPPPVDAIANTAVRRDLLSPLLGQSGVELITPTLAEMGPKLAERIPTEFVYVTVDLDVLDEADFEESGWGTGAVRTAQIVSAIQGLAAQRRLIGGDLTGYPPVFNLPPLAPPHRCERCERSYLAVATALREGLQASRSPRGPRAGAAP